MDSPGELLGESPAIVAVRDKLRHLIGHGRRAGRLPVTLIQGETGTGKGLVAHLLHRAGPRHGGPFVDVNCAAIPEPLLEAELFGFERGAFTDARQAKPGLVQVAHGGTLFLDEIGLLPLGLQAKLLKVIEERAVRRLGGTRSEPVDVWIVAASSEDLAASAAARGFRSDLYHRISVVTLRLPPLRQRRGDILLLAEHFLTRTSADYGLARKTLAEDARAALLDYAWPGNVRELGNVMERVALLSDSPVVTASLLALTEGSSPEDQGAEAEGLERPLGLVVEEIEQARIVEALRHTGGNVSRAAARLGMPRDKLRYRLEKYGLRGAASAPRQQRGAPAGGAGPATTTVPGAQRPATTIQWEYRFLAVLRALLISPGEPEGWTKLSRPLEGLVEKVRTFGGRVEEVSPNGVIALFGLDREGGDAATRAAFAALALEQTAARTMRGEAPRITGKVAIHAGRFLVGQVSGAPQLDLEAKRDALAVLEALMPRAEIGAIAVSGSAAPFLERRFTLMELESAARGDERGYRLLARKGAEFWGRLTVFVGRAQELALLHGRLASAARGQGQALGIAGEPGIGKSRLLYEFQHCLPRERGPRCLTAHCFSFASSTPYFPIVETVRTVCGLAEGDSSAVAAEKVRATLESLGLEATDGTSYLLDVLRIGDAPIALAGLDSDAVRTRTFEILRRLYLALSRRQPLILAIEDLHWIDGTSEEFLASLIDALPGAGILVVATYRPGYRPPWMEKSYVTQIALPALSPQESLGLLQSILSPERVPQGLAPLILAKAEGNPFFLEELARAVAPDVGEGTVAVPDTIQDVLMARIEQVPAASRQVLQVASVCGREVSLTLLEEVWDGPGALDAHLHELVQREFVALRIGGEAPLCTFTHALTQEVAYRSLDDAMRRRWHARVAQTLSSRFPQLVATRPELLAQHFTGAGLAGPAVRYWLLAGQQARGRSAYTEAITHLTRGLDAVPSLPESSERSGQEIALQLALGASLAPLKGFGSPEVAHAYARARQLCREIGHSPRLFNALSGLEAFDFARGELRRARELGDECLALAAELGDSSMIYRSSNAMGGVLVHVGEQASAHEHLQRAITLVEAAAERPAAYHSSVMHPLVFALSYDSWALWLLGYPDRALRASEDALTIVARLDHPHTRVFALHYASVLRQLRRDAGVILPQANAVVALASEHGFPPYRAVGVMMRGWALAERGEVDEALAEIQHGLAAFRETGTEMGRPFFLGLLTAAHAGAGQVKEALGVLAEATAHADERHEHAWDAELRRLRGELLLADPVRDPRGAETCFQEAIAVARSQQARSWELRAALSLGRFLADAGRREEGRAAVADVYRRFTEGFDTRDLTEAGAFLEA